MVPSVTLSPQSSLTSCYIMLWRTAYHCSDAFADILHIFLFFSFFFPTELSFYLLIHFSRMSYILVFFSGLWPYANIPQTLGWKLWFRSTTKNLKNQEETLQTLRSIDKVKWNYFAFYLDSQSCWCLCRMFASALYVISGIQNMRVSSLLQVNFPHVGFFSNNWIILCTDSFLPEVASISLLPW